MSFEDYYTNNTSPPPSPLGYPPSGRSNGAPGQYLQGYLFDPIDPSQSINNFGNLAPPSSSVVFDELQAQYFEQTLEDLSSGHAVYPSFMQVVSCFSDHTFQFLINVIHRTQNNPCRHTKPRSHTFHNPLPRLRSLSAP